MWACQQNIIDKIISETVNKDMLLINKINETIRGYDLKQYAGYNLAQTA
jgi:hypothetical protein